MRLAVGQPLPPSSPAPTLPSPGPTPPNAEPEMTDRELSGLRCLGHWRRSACFRRRSLQRQHQRRTRSRLQRTTWCWCTVVRPTVPAGPRSSRASRQPACMSPRCKTHWHRSPILSPPLAAKWRCGILDQPKSIRLAASLPCLDRLGSMELSRRRLAAPSYHPSAGKYLGDVVKSKQTLMEPGRGFANPPMGVLAIPAKPGIVAAS